MNERPALGQRKQFLMLVKTYPTPSTKYGETVCCAGIDADQRRWVRIFPVNFRSLDEYRRFSKWQFIDAEWTKASDSRPESVKVYQDSIRPGETIPAGARGWPRRRAWMDPLLDPSLEALKREQLATGKSLGLIQPRSIDGFTIRKAGEWDQESRDGLRQLALAWTDQPTPTGDLEILPFDFRYQFHCDDDDCLGHDMEVFDWEVGQSYRKWRRTYGEDGWRRAMRTKYLEELPARDLHFVVGTHHRWQSWMIVGLLYPPHPQVLESEEAPVGEHIGEGEPMTLPFVGLEAEEGDGPLAGETDDRD